MTTVVFSFLDGYTSFLQTTGTTIKPEFEFRPDPILTTELATLVSLKKSMYDNVTSLVLSFLN